MSAPEQPRRHRGPRRATRAMTTDRGSDDMSFVHDAPVPDETAPPTTDPPGEPKRRRRPEQTRDDTDAGWGEPAEDGKGDDWYRAERPPHWG